MEENIIKEFLTQVGLEYGPYAVFFIYLLIYFTKKPIKKFMDGIDIADIIAFRSQRIKTRDLQKKLKSMKNSASKEKEVGDLIDTLRDKFDFKYTYVSVFFNGQYDLLGMGKYKYSIDYEKSRYDSPTIKHLYQNKSLISHLPVLSVVTKNKEGLLTKLDYKTELIEVDLANADINHPLKSLYYSHGAGYCYIMLIASGVTVPGKNSTEFLPIGELVCLNEKPIRKGRKDLISDLHLTRKEISQILDKYSD